MRPLPRSRRPADLFGLVRFGLLTFGLGALALTRSSASGAGNHPLIVPTGVWQQTGAMTFARAGASATLLPDGRVLVAGGTDSSGAVIRTTELFAPGANGFTAAAPMQAARASHASVLLRDGRVLVVGGMGVDGRAQSSAEIFDSDAGGWSVTGSMFVARTGATATVLPDGTVLIAGGDDAGTPTATLEVFDPETETFSLARESMTEVRTGHAAASLADGRVLISGGFDGTGVLASADVFDPSTGSVSAAAPMSTARAGHSATPLLDGRILVAGGAGASSELASVELFYPEFSAFVPASGHLLNARQRHVALLLPHNNNVLVVGGSAGMNAVPTAELYLPAEDAFVATTSPSAARTWASAAALSMPASLTTRTGPTDGVVLVAGGSASPAATNPRSSAEAYGFATVKTDRADYKPGESVTITGSGWVPGETVTLAFLEIPDFDPHPPITAVADGDGRIRTNEFVPDVHDQDITFYLTATGAASQAQTVFTDAGVATKLVFTVLPPSSVGAGAAFGASVAVEDSVGNIITTSSAGITISSSPAGVLATATASSGVATFSGLSLGTAGSYTLTATGTNLTAATATVAVNAGTSAQVMFVQQPPAAVLPGETFRAVVAVMDAFGNLISGASPVVSLTSSPAGLGGTTSQTASGGIATFSNLTVSPSGTYTLTASAASLASGTSVAFTALHPSIGDVAVSVDQARTYKLKASDGTIVTGPINLGNCGGLAVDPVDYGVYLGTAPNCTGGGNNAVWKFAASGAQVFSTIYPGCGASGGYYVGNGGIAVDATSATPGVVLSKSGYFGDIGKVSRTNGAFLFCNGTNDLGRPSIDPSSGQIFAWTNGGLNYRTLYSVPANGSGMATFSSCDSNATDLNPADGALYRGGGACGVTLAQMNRANLAQTNWSLALTSVLSSVDSVAVQPWTNGYVYVGSVSSSKVAVVDPATQTVLSTFTTAVPPAMMAVSPAGGNVYVANWGGSSVAAYSPGGALLWTQTFAGQITNLAAVRNTPGSSGGGTSAAATRLSFTVPPPASIPWGTIFSTTVAAQDSAGVTVPTVSPSITLTSNPPGLGGITTRTTTLGSAVFSGLSYPAPGTYTVTASAAGLAGATSSVTVTQVGTATGLVSSLNPSNAFDAVTFTATVWPLSGSGIPTGTVTFRDGSTVLGTASLGGDTATLTTAALAGGNRSITATYNGDANYGSSTSNTVTQAVVRGNTTTIIASHTPDPSLTGQPVAVNVAVLPAPPFTVAPTGSVSVTLSGGSCAVTLVNGIGSCSLSAPTAGAGTLSASYAGDSFYNPSSGTAPHTVNRADTTTTLTSAFNPSWYRATVTFTATVSTVSPGGGTPTGSVQFQDNGTTIGTASLSSGVATFTTSSLTAGSHPIQAVYNVNGASNANYNPSMSSTLTQSVAQPTTSTTIASSVNPTVFGQNTTFTATVRTPAANASFALQSSSTSPQNVYGVAAADYSGDGKPDLAYVVYGSSPQYTGSSVQLRMGAGNGNFNAATAITVSNGPQWIAFGDFNADGRLDLVTSSFVSTTTTNPGNVNVLLQNPNGTFAAPVSYTTGPAPVFVGVADLNGDNRPDLVTANQGNGFNNTLSVLLGNANGTFQAATNVTVATGPSSVAAADYNADGRMDLAVSNQNSHTVGVLLGNGNGTFGAQTQFGLGGGLGPRSVATGDVNGDGKLDLLTANASTSNVSVLLGNGTGGFTFSSIVPTASVTATIALADFNADGKLDFVETNRTANNASVHLGTGAGNFAPPVTLGTATTPHGLAVADFNSDGKPDFATGATAGNTVQAFLNTASPAIVSEGSFTFNDSTTAIGGPVNVNGSGQATFSTQALAAGTHPITATYNPGPNFATSISTAVNQTVNQAGSATSLTSSPNPSEFNQAVHVTATVSPVAPASGVPSGTVTFKEGANVLATSAVDASRTAAADIVLSIAGSPHSIVAVYSGDGNFAASTSPAVAQSVVPALPTITLTTTSSSAVFGQPVTLTATLASPAGTPTGLVTFKDFSTPVGTGTLDASGAATFITSSLSPQGTHLLTASYSGDASFASVTSPVLTQYVFPADTTTSVASSVNPALTGQAITFTASVSAVAPGAGTPSGTVTFQAGGADIGSAVLSGAGTAAFSTASLSVGSHSITARYDGDSNFNASASLPLLQDITSPATTTTVTSSVNPSVVGQPVIFTASVTAVGGTPAGSVTFMDAAATLGTAALTGGSASFEMSSLPAGSHAITAVYGGDAAFTSSTSGVLTQDVGQALTTTTVSSAINPSVYGQSVTMTATVAAVAPGAGIPTGTVTFMDGAVPLETVPLDGAGCAVFASSTLPGGDHGITVRYDGDANFAQSGGALVQSVTPLSTHLDAVATYDPATQAIHVTATLTAGGAPLAGQNLAFSFDGLPVSISPVPVTNAQGIVSFEFMPAVSVGSHQLHVTFTGNASFGEAAADAVFDAADTAPTFDVPPTPVDGAVIDVQAGGGSFNAILQSQDVNPGDTVRFNYSPLPGSMAATLETHDQDPARLGRSWSTLTLAWSPTGQDVGPHVFTFEAVDNHGYGSTTTLTINVTPPPVTLQSVTVQPSAASVHRGQHQQFQALGHYSDGTSAPLVAGVQWHSNDPGIASVDQDGDAQGLALGQTLIIATFQDISCMVSQGECGSLNVVNVAPTATFTNSGPVSEGNSVTVSFNNAFDVDSQAGFHYVYDCMGDPIVGATYANTASNASQNCAFADGPSVHTVRARIIDEDDGYAEYTTDITVLNQVPRVNGPIASGSQVGSTTSFACVSFFDVALDSPFTARVDYGDGSPAENPAILPVDGSCNGPGDAGWFRLSHAYAETGAFTVNVSVTDKDQGTGTFQFQVSVDRAASQTLLVSSTGQSPSVYGQDVTFTATVTGQGGNAIVPTGSVIFTVDLDQTSAVVVPLNASGQASFSTGTLAAIDCPQPPAQCFGHNVTAQYSGDTTFLQSSQFTNQFVNRAGTTTSLISSQNPSNFGAGVTFAATVSRPDGLGAVTAGTVTFVIDGNQQPQQSVDGNGQAFYSTSTLSANTHNVQALYNSPSNYMSSSAQLSQTVTLPPPTLSVAPTTVVSGQGNPTISGTGVPGANIQLQDGGSPLCPFVLVDGGGAWSTTTCSFRVGTHVVTATQSMNGPASAPSGAVTLHVKPNAPGINSPSSVISAVSPATVTLSGFGFWDSFGPSPQGATVTIFEGSTPLATATVVSNGTGGGAWSAAVSLPYGSHPLRASQTIYGETSDLSNTFTVNVSAPLSPPTLGASPTTVVSGAQITLSGTGMPGASIQIFDGAANTGGPTVGAGGTWSTTRNFVVGSHMITAKQQLNGQTSGASLPVTVHVRPSQPGISSPSFVLSQTSPVSLTLNGFGFFSPSLGQGATVTVFEGTNQLGMATVQSTGAWSLPVSMAYGSHSLRASQTLAGETSDLSAVFATTVAQPPSFSQAGPVIPGCICTPITDIDRGSRSWFVTADASGRMAITLKPYGTGSDPNTSVSVTVFSGASQVPYDEGTPLAASYAPGLFGPGASATRTIPTTAGAVYRVSVTTADTTGFPKRYALKFDGATEAGMPNPSYNITGGDHERWLVNVDELDAMGVRIFSAGTPQPPPNVLATQNVTYYWVSPAGIVTQPQTLTAAAPPGIDAMIPPPPDVTPGVWALFIASNQYYRLEKTTGVDRGIYLNAFTAGQGFGTISILYQGAPYAGTVTAHISKEDGEAFSLEIENGFFAIADVDPGGTDPGVYHIELDAPDGLILTPPAQDLVVRCDGQTDIAFELVAKPTITSFAPAAATVGTSVDIIGSGFTGAASVTFNGVSASFVLVSDSTLKATVPATATTGRIAVTTAAAAATSVTDFIVIVAPPTLSLPGNITVDATGPLGAVVTYSASAADGAGGSLPVTCLPASGSTFPIGTTTVTCTAVDAGGTGATGSFTVLVQGAAAQVSNLVVLLESFNLAPGMQNSLDAKLQNILSALTGGQTGNALSACNQLAAFINETAAQSGKRLTVAQSNQLSDAARRIRAVAGCR